MRGGNWFSGAFVGLGIFAIGQIIDGKGDQGIFEAATLKDPFFWILIAAGALVGGRGLR